MTTETKQDVTTETESLSSQEEQVVRMRHGLRAPNDLALQSKAAGNADVEAKLKAMEEEILKAAGVRNNSTKRNIVSQLRRRDS